MLPGLYYCKDIKHHYLISILSAIKKITSENPDKVFSL